MRLGTDIESTDSETVCSVTHSKIVLHASQTGIADVDAIEITHEQHHSDLQKCQPSIYYSLVLKTYHREEDPVQFAQ
jgi:hypothetical protein